MSYSIGEISDLCIKAARGCGKPWGLAEEVGWAIRWLVRAGWPGPDRLALILSGKDGVCPVTLGVAVADSGQVTLLDTAGSVAEPLLLLPFLSRLAPKGRALRVSIEERPFRVTAFGTDVGMPIPISGAVRVTGDAAMPPTRPPHTRVEQITPEAYEILNEMAARTYAPASEMSRQRGAGAGLVDND
ncbi:MAG: DUF3726 domain-containing protein [Pseudomonadota bacterium]